MSGKNIKLDVTLIMEAAWAGFKRKYYLLGQGFYLFAYFVYTLTLRSVIPRVRFSLVRSRKKCLFFL